MKSVRNLLTSLFMAGLFMLQGCNADCVECFVDCRLEPDPGFCLAYFPKYYFNRETRQCEQFIWGGCGGVVPFDTLEECEACECH